MNASIPLRTLCALTLLSACTPANTPPKPSPAASGQASPKPSPTPVTSSNPVSSPSSGPGQAPNVSLPADVSPDTAMRQELLDILSQLAPDVEENPVVSALALEHAVQIAGDAKATEFRVKAVYDPVAPGGLQTRLLQAGIYTSDNLVNAYLSDGSAASVRDRFAKQVQGILGPVDFSHFGLAVVRKGPSWFVSFVMLTEILHLDNLPISVAGIGTRQVTGEIKLPGYAQPHILVTRPDGTVGTIDTQVNGNRFSASVPLNQTGLYSFEVNVVGPLGPLPGTNFVLAVGVPYPKPAPISDSSEKISDVAKARQTLLDLVNKDRVAMGLSALKADDKLGQAAQSHSDDMVKNGFIGHNSPTQGTPQQQAFLFQVSDLVSQNLAVSRTLANSQRELMSSPGHRKTILSPDHTHVGFGVTNGPDGFLYITQLFAQQKLQLESLPTSIGSGQSFSVKGKATQTGFVAAFLDQNIIGEPVAVTAGQAFNLPVKIDKSGKQRLRIGYSEPPKNNLFNFIFYNIWDLNVN